MTARLHVITDDDVLARPDVVGWSVKLIEGFAGRLALHVRGPRTAGGRVFEVAAAVHNEVGGGSLFINDRVDVALALRDTGVHLRATSLSPETARRLLGSGRTLGLSVRAELPVSPDLDRVDYVIAGTAFSTPSHPEGPVAGPEAIHRLASASPVPVLAIGGISAARIGVLVRNGVHGVAVLRAVWSDPDPSRAAREILTALDRTDRSFGPRDHE